MQSLPDQINRGPWTWLYQSDPLDHVYTAGTEFAQGTEIEHVQLAPAAQGEWFADVDYWELVCTRFHVNPAIQFSDLLNLVDNCTITVEVDGKLLISPTPLHPAGFNTVSRRQASFYKTVPVVFRDKVRIVITVVEPFQLSPGGTGMQLAFGVQCMAVKKAEAAAEPGGQA